MRERAIVQQQAGPNLYLITALRLLCPKAAKSDNPARKPKGIMRYSSV